MLAQDLIEEAPLVDIDCDALDAARMMAKSRLPGLVVVTAGGAPYAVLPGSQVARLIVPPYVRENPTLAKVYRENTADEVAHMLSGRTIRQLVPEPDTRLVAQSTDHVLQLAELMGRARGSLVAIVEDDRVIGVVTAARLLELGCGAA